MRLLKLNHDSTFSVAEFFGNDIPRYAILSHTWMSDGDEVTYQDVINHTGTHKRGFAKLRFCTARASSHGLEYSWIDTCCIDKSSSAELSEAINSMFTWYQTADRCYVYLSDVSSHSDWDRHREEYGQNRWKSDFKKSRWFRRGWTLQELIAPRSVEFYSKEEVRLGDKGSLEQTISEITSIPVSALRGQSLFTFTTSERMAWAKNRETKREEDAAYSLLGLFETHMPLIYGEKRVGAMRRLLQQVARTSSTAFDQAGVHYDSTKPSYSQDDHDEKSSHMPDSMSTNTSGSRTGDSGRIMSGGQPDSPTDESSKLLLDSLRFAQIDARRDTIKSAHRNTCRWFLKRQEYANWLDVAKLSEHHGFLWIKGKAGSGKSTLMKYASAHAAKSLKSWKTITFFFNARGTEIEKSTMGMYRSLLVQILEKVPRLQRSLSSRKPPADQWTIELLEDMLHDLIADLGDEQVLVFVDALDESSEPQIRSMISFFEGLGDLAVGDGIRFNVCFSSRHYPHISIAKSVNMELDGQEGHAGDIETYLETELKIGKSKPEEQIRQEVKEKSRGIFLWVVLVTDILNKAFDRGRIRDLRRKLNETPSDLYTLFHDILTRDLHNQEDMVLCIQWVLFAKEPLRPEQLYYAILAGNDPAALGEWNANTEPLSMIELFILSCSKGLTEVTKSKARTVQFIHESVRDFLLKEGGLGKLWPEYADNFEAKSHDRLKECCSTYLNIDTRPVWTTGAAIPRAPSERKKLDEHVGATFPLLKYSLNGLFHSEKAAKIVSQVQFIRHFELEQWETWRLIHNLFEQYETRRRPENTRLAYVLAEIDLPYLLLCCELEFSPLEVGAERYGTPLFAALACGKADVAFGLLDILANARHPKHLPREFFETDVWRGNFSRGFVFKKPGRTVQSCLEEFSHPDIHQILTVDGVDEGSNTERIKFALSRRNHSFFKILLDRNPKFSAKGWNCASAIYEIAKNGDRGLLKLLLSRGAHIDSEGINGSPLYMAIYRSDLEATRLLLESGADAGVKDLMSVLSVVGLHGAYAPRRKRVQKDILKLLIAHGTNINLPYVGYSCVLQAAAELETEEMVQILLDNGADINKSSEVYGNALSSAAFIGRLETVQILLDNGADINKSSQKYGSALYSAAFSGRLENVQILLRHGADVNLQGGEYGSALQAVTIQIFPGKSWSKENTTDREDIMQALLDHGADVNIRGGNYGTALQAACFNTKKELVRILLDNGADVNIQGGMYGTALQAACVKGEKELVRILLNNGADVNMQGGRYGTALQAACASREKELVRILLNHGADVNMRGGNHGSALQAAVCGYRSAGEQFELHAKEEIVQLLIEHGADVNIPGARYSSVLEEVRSFGRPDLAKILIAAGARG